jgi:hypothetical protein
MENEQRPLRKSPNMNTDTPVQPMTEEDTLIRIEVSSSQRVNIWAQIIKNKFVGRYLGKNRFAFERSEIELLRSAGIDFQIVGP